MEQQRKKKAAAGPLLCILVALLPAGVCAGREPHRQQDLPGDVARLEQEMHQALRQGDLDRVTRLAPQAERLETQLLQILETPRSTTRDRERLVPLLELVRGLQAQAGRFSAGRAWRDQPRPRIEHPPNPKLLVVDPGEDGQTWIVGAPGAAGDTRARIVRVVNLLTADEAAVWVRRDGSFQVRLVAPPGSPLQISISMNEDLPEELRKGLDAPWGVDLTNLREEFRGVIAGDRSCSPGLILTVKKKNPAARDEACFVRKIAPEHWLFGTARLARTHLKPGELGEVAIALSLRCESKAATRRLAGLPFDVSADLTPLFDPNGMHLSAMRLLATHVLTPTGLPIETHTDLVGRRDPQGRFHMEPGPRGVPTHFRDVRFGPWRVEGRMAKVPLTFWFEIPGDAPAGVYSLNGHFHPRGGGPRSLPRQEVLFDNVADPFQVKNLANDSAYRPHLEKYRDMLKARMARLNDTFPASTWYRDHWTDGNRRIVASANGPFPTGTPG